MKETIVLTGASSGIGRLTAYRLASRQANLVLAARSLPDLTEVAAECERLGARVTIQQTDVSRERDVITLSDTAESNYGKIDAWINCAGITVLGTFLDTSSDEFEQVIRTNFMGTTYGSRAALKVFTRQEEGTLINIASVLGAIPIPYESAYVASKYAIRGFSASLRQEMYLEGYTNVHVCTLLPATMSTPIYQNAANVTGKVAQSIPPVYQADLTADAIYSLIDKPRPEVVVGGAGNALIGIRNLLPIVSERLLARYIKAFHYKNEPATQTEGNLLEAGKQNASYGGQPTVPKYFDAVAVASTGLLTLVIFIIKKSKARN